jgi:hypothetical protein
LIVTKWLQKFQINKNSDNFCESLERQEML